MLSIIVAMSENRVIGRAGTLPWHLSADLKRFKKLTMGHAIVMGRKTYESIGRPLPGRASIVLSRDPEYVIAGTDVVENLEQALAKTKEEEVFVIGGAQLYEIALPLAERLYLTEVGTTIDGDVFFPTCDWSQWELVESLPLQIDEKSGLPYCFKTYHRTKIAAGRGVPPQ